MSRPPRDTLRREILEVSQRLFSTIGFRAASLQMVADGAGCSKALLLYHFHSKSAILGALSAPLVADVELLRVELTATPADQRQARTLELAVALVVRHREAIAMLRGLSDVEELRELSERGAECSAEIAAGLVGPVPSQRERVAAVTFERGVVGACLALPDLTDDELSGALLEIGARMFDRSASTTVR